MLIDTGYDGEVFLYHDQLRQAGLEITFTRMDRIQLAIVLAAAVYFVLLWPGVRLLSRLEHRMLASRR